MKCHSTTPWSWVLLEKQTGSQIAKKFPAFYGAWRFITAFTHACHLSLSWASSIQSTPPHLTSWRSILILSSHLYLCLPSGLFPSGFPTKILYTPLPHMCYMHRPYHSSWFNHPNNIWVSSTHHCAPHYVVSSTPCYLIPLRPKYSPQHPTLKHPQLTFLPQCKQPSFTPIQNKR